jgi:hypothetical protein
VIVVRLIKRGAVGTAITALLAAFVGASPAPAAMPWWQVTPSSRPTILRAGSGSDDVQTLTVSATKGEVFLAEPERLAEVERGTRSFEDLLYALLPYNASAQQMQEALQQIYPSRVVLVSGGPGDEGGTKPYTITFPGQSAKRVFASGEFAVIFGGESLSGGRAEAKVEEVEKGKPDGQIVVTASNLGDAPANGATAPISILDNLPVGLKAVSIESTAGAVPIEELPSAECALASLACRYRGPLPEYDDVEVRIGVEVQPGAASGEVDEARASGGEAANVTATRPLQVGSEPTPFGIEDNQLTPEEEGGAAATQAGSHPFQVTGTFTLNQVLKAEPGGTTGLESIPAGLPKDVIAKLPPGLVGNPTPLPQCTMAQFLTRGPNFGGVGGGENLCPPQTAVGVAMVDVNLPVLGELTFVVPIFNLEPPVGEPARFGFVLPNTPVVLDASVRTGGDYGVSLGSYNISQTAALLSFRLSFWGVPGDPRHDNQRGWGCLETFHHFLDAEPCQPFEAHKAPPFLALPTSCASDPATGRPAPLTSSLEADSWKEPRPEGLRLSFPTDPMESLDGCNRLPFSASIEDVPDGQAGSTPTGLTVDVHVPQDLVLNPTGLAEANVRDTTVTLPAGVVLNPAAADGLQSCSEAQVALDRDTPATCPDAAKVGTVEIKTPLLANQLVGSAYLAAQDANPFGSLVALYVVARDPISGTLVKVAGEVRPDPVTGQLVSTFKDTPQLPFEDFKLHFFGGDRAPLGTPAQCGSYTTTASIAPWSGNPPSESSSAFEVTSGPNGSPCASPLPFQPSLTAGTTSIQAGGFTPFRMTMSREDGQQNLGGITLKMPPGMSGTLSAVKLCGESQANEGTCGPESLIGETIVSVGLGGDPFSVRGGKVYITGPYRGAPFGLSIVNPAKAGPFDLGKVIVRAKVDVDQETAALTITTDNEGPYKIPTIIDGIPLQIKHVNVDINRPGFTFNATNCSPLQITGTLTSTEGSQSALSVPYQITNCAVLAFKPKLTASVSGRASRANGASLRVKLGYPAGPYDANIAKVKVELPKALPSRLTTLQKACTAAVFNQNPANCPAASIVGHATATTPVLPVSLTGPAIFVSHGGEAFPSLIIVLQGYGVTVHLVGSTFISKTGITSSTFKTVPDVPVGTFELTLPQGPFSALTTNTNPCKAKLVMPTEFIGQNGALIKTNTKMAVTGCAKHKRKKSRHRRAGGRRGRHR